MIRPARKGDLRVLGRLGSELARLHHAWDPQRFFLEEPLEEGYSWWLGRELANPKAVVLTAARGRRVVGYAYGLMTPRHWNSLRDRCGYLIDLMVAGTERDRGTGQALLQRMCEALAAKGAPRVVLHTAARNPAARRLFRRMGFRPTMIEMTRELAAPAPRVRRRMG